MDDLGPYFRKPPSIYIYIYVYFKTGSSAVFHTQVCASTVSSGYKPEEHNGPLSSTTSASESCLLQFPDKPISHIDNLPKSRNSVVMSHVMCDSNAIGMWLFHNAMIFTITPNGSNWFTIPKRELGGWSGAMLSFSPHGKYFHGTFTNVIRNIYISYHIISYHPQHVISHYITFYHPITTLYHIIYYVIYIYDPIRDSPRMWPCDHLTSAWHQGILAAVFIQLNIMKSRLYKVADYIM